MWQVLVVASVSIWHLLLFFMSVAISSRNLSVTSMGQPNVSISSIPWTTVVLLASGITNRQRTIVVSVMAMYVSSSRLVPITLSTSIVG